MSVVDYLRGFLDDSDRRNQQTKASNQQETLRRLITQLNRRVIRVETMFNEVASYLSDSDKTGFMGAFGKIRKPVFENTIQWETVWQDLNLFDKNFSVQDLQTHIETLKILIDECFQLQKALVDIERTLLRIGWRLDGISKQFTTASKRLSDASLYLNKLAEIGSPSIDPIAELLSTAAGMIQKAEAALGQKQYEEAEALVTNAVRVIAQATSLIERWFKNRAKAEELLKNCKLRLGVLHIELKNKDELFKNIKATFAPSVWQDVVAALPSAYRILRDVEARLELYQPVIQRQEWGEAIESLSVDMRSLDIAERKIAEIDKLETRIQILYSELKTRLGLAKTHIGDIWSLLISRSQDLPKELFDQLKATEQLLDTVMNKPSRAISFFDTFEKINSVVLEADSIATKAKRMLEAKKETVVTN